MAVILVNLMFLFNDWMTAVWSLPLIANGSAGVVLPLGQRVVLVYRHNLRTQKSLPVMEMYIYEFPAHALNP